MKLPQQLQELTFGHSFSGLAQTILPDTWAGKMSLEGRGVCWKQQFISFDNVSLGEFVDHSQAEAGRGRWKILPLPSCAQRNAQIPRRQMEHQQISKVVLKNSVVFLSGGVSISGVVVASKIVRIFWLHAQTHKKLGGRKSGSNFAGSKTPTRLTVVYMLNIVSSKEAHL